MIKVKLLERPPTLRSILGNTKSNLSRAMTESAKLVKDNIKAELRDPNKTGTAKPKSRRRASPARRSAAGESLARDTGASERLISSDKTSDTSVKVGFKENPFGFDYVAYQELENNRPTMQKAVEKSLKGIENIFDKNLKPKK